MLMLSDDLIVGYQEDGVPIKAERLSRWVWKAFEVLHLFYGHYPSGVNPNLDTAFERVVEVKQWTDNEKAKEA